MSFKKFDEFTRVNEDASSGSKSATHSEFRVGQRWGWHSDTASVGSYVGPCVVKVVTDTTVTFRFFDDTTKRIKLDKAREMVKGNLLKPQN